MPALAFPLGDAEHTGRSAAGPGLDDIAAPGWALWCGRGAITGWVRTDQAVPSAFGLDAAGNFLSRRLTARRCSRPSPFRAAASSCWRRNHSLPAGRARNRRNNARTDAQELARPKIFDPRIASAPFVAVLLSDLRPARSDHQPGSPWPQRHGVTRAHASRNHPLNISLQAVGGMLLLGAPMRGGCEGLEPRCPPNGPKVPIDSEEDRAELYRRSAENLRQVAAQVRFNFGRQQQLLALAEAFDRLAERAAPSLD